MQRLSILVPIAVGLGALACGFGAPAPPPAGVPDGAPDTPDGTSGPPEAAKAADGPVAQAATNALAIPPPEGGLERANPAMVGSGITMR